MVSPSRRIRFEVQIRIISNICYHYLPVASLGTTIDGNPAVVCIPGRMHVATPCCAARALRSDGAPANSLLPFCATKGTSSTQTSPLAFMWVSTIRKGALSSVLLFFLTTPLDAPSTSACSYSRTKAILSRMRLAKCISHRPWGDS